jgi:hypothetical protein
MTRRIAVTRRVAVGATLALTAGLGWVGTGAASAATPQASCAFSGSMGFTPNLTQPNPPATPPSTTVNLSGTLSNCKGKSGVKSGTATGTIPIGQQTCTSVIFPPRTLGTGTMTVKWKGGTSSLVKVTLAVGSSDFSLSGPVTKNRFKGHKFNAPHLAPGAITPSNFHCRDDGSQVPVQAIGFSGQATVN